MEVKKKKDEESIPTGTELLITLKVDTVKLYSIEHPTREDINAYCELYDSNPPESHKHVSIEEFESIVVPGQQVKWIAVPKDPESNFTIAVESIVYAHYKDYEDDKFKEENFFKAIAICSSDDRTVRSKVKEPSEPGKYVYIYNLNFNIRREGIEARCFSIDPRLKIVE